ncbi:MAG: hypothetical protein JWN44_3993 [Myxococcales bacterium]|nr:hypothetical protein [Myxococcales bacterium]
MKMFGRIVQALTLCVVGCSPHQDQIGGGHDLSGTGDGVDMTTSSLVDTGDMAGPLVITPLDQTLTAAPGAMPTLAFSATVNGAPVSPAWTIDRGELGSIGVSTGSFSASGTIGGKGIITASYLGQTASTSLTVQLQQLQNGDPGYPALPPGAGGYGGVGGHGPAPSASTGQTGVLTGAPTADASVKMLYPYDATVWPRGLLAPLFMWDPGTRKFDAVMLKLHSKNFDYTGTFATNNGASFIDLPIPEQVWHTLSYSNGGKGDPITVTLVFEDVSTATPVAIGPYTMTWNIAPGTLKGTVYYNSYGTALVVNPANSAQVGNSGENSFGTATGNGPPFGAATLAIRPGTTAPVVVAGTYSANMTGCRVCHSVSTNGQKLITQHGDNYAVSSMYDLTTNAESAVSGTAHNFPALAPDGSWFMSDSGATVATAGDTTTRAYTASGALMTAQPTGIPAGLKATLPTFSPDGKHLAFNFWASTSAGGDQKSLAVLDYDPANQVFSNLRTLFTPTTGAVSWSSFLPTNDAVVVEDELVAGNGQYGFTWVNGQGQLHWVDLATKTAHALDNLNGSGYLPSYAAHTGAADAKLNYEPTVNPVVSGGYAWVVFTSRRLYGNVATTSAYNSDPRKYDWQHIVTPKKLWVAAIDLNAPAGTDPSHPAFYLPAQELLAGNARGFWTVDPCHTDGTGCETGDECCGGYCRPGGDAGALICTNQQPSCSQEFEKCSVTADCCGATSGVMCINGICGKSQPIP